MGTPLAGSPLGRAAGLLALRATAWTRTALVQASSPRLHACASTSAPASSSPSSSSALSSSPPAYSPSSSSASSPTPSSSPQRRLRRPWTTTEDEVVLRAVGAGGTGDWATIAKELGNRDPRTVRQRYVDTLQNRSAAVRPWSPGEDELLQRAVHQVGGGGGDGALAWTSVAALLPSRTAKQCSQRWYNHVRSQPSREPWMPDEDARLIALARTHGRKWRKIASLLGGRSPFQCRWRLETALSPDRKPWTDDDSARLLALFRDVGPQWALIAQQIRSRSDYELRKIFLREHRAAYAQWLRDHDVAQRERTTDLAASTPERVRSRRTQRAPNT